MDSRDTSDKAVRCTAAVRTEGAACELVDVSVVYPKSRHSEEVTVVECLTVTAVPGQITCLAGRSGSGKTTVLRIAAALQRPSHGNVFWGPTEVSALPPSAATAERATTIGYARQREGLVDFLTAIENVLVGRPPHLAAPTDQERAASLLTRLGLGSRLNALPRTLSGGESQRVLLARALLGEPPILLIDEPTAALDRSTAELAIALLAECATNGQTVLIASHDEQVLDRADNVVKLS